MDKNINFFDTTISESAIKNVTEVLRSTRISAGQQCEIFEKKLSEKGLINPVTLNSGTVTMHLALIASGVGPGDEVIIPAQTFIATGLAVLYVGAKPVFADINYYDGNILVESIKDKITNKTKAIIPVHWAGYPCDLDEINKLATEHNLSVIEDAAHAFGATYKNNPIGSISRFTSFSFQAIKNLTTGDGGALCCLNSDDFKLVKKLRWFDIDRENTNVGFLGEREYNATNIGYKYHMNDISASLGIGNIEFFDNKLKRLNEISNWYRQELSGTPGLQLLKYNSDRKSSNWLFPLLVEDRINFVKKMKCYDIPVSVVHLGIDKNEIFGGKDFSLKNQRKFDENQIHIPINISLDDLQIEKIIKTIKKG
jgi:perosamine synthetase